MLQVLKFSATWCQPCKALAPKFEEIKQKYSDNPNIVFQELDVDKCQDLATKYIIRSVPTVIILKGEPNKMEVIERISGNVPEKIEAAIEKHIN